MEVEAKARYMRIPPRKARLVAATVIGMPVKDALVVLDFTPKAAAQEIGKVVKSAAANATNNFSQDEDALVVKRIIVNEGPTLKRGRARARGMYFSIFKRTSHITAVVEAEEAQARPTRRRAAAAAETPSTPAKTQKPKAAATRAEESQVEDVKVEEPKPEAASVEEIKAEEVAEVAEEQRAVEAEAGAAPVTPEEPAAAKAVVAEDAVETPALEAETERKAEDTERVEAADKAETVEKTENEKENA
jgi:large subunit ribosomal protein L22